MVSKLIMRHLAVGISGWEIRDEAGAKEGFFRFLLFAASGRVDVYRMAVIDYVCTIGVYRTSFLGNEISRVSEQTGMHTSNLYT